MLVSAANGQGKAVRSPRSTGAIPWLAIERATNGYLVRDSAAGDTWLIADDDWFEAAAELLAEINDRLGSSGDAYDERRVKVAIEPGERFQAINPDDCPHDRVLNFAYGAAGEWACRCGLEFVPVPRSAEGEVAA